MKYIFLFALLSSISLPQLNHYIKTYKIIASDGQIFEIDSYELVEDKIIVKNDFGQSEEYSLLQVYQIQSYSGDVLWTNDKINKPNNRKFKRRYNFLTVNGKVRPLWNFKEPKNPIHSGLFSLIIPSGGHIYNEQYIKGYFYLFGVPLLYLGGSLVAANNLDNDSNYSNDNKNSNEGVVAGVLIQFSALMLHFYNVYDAVISSNKINKEYYRIYLEEEKTSKQQE